MLNKFRFYIFLLFTLVALGAPMVASAQGIDYDRTIKAYTIAEFTPADAELSQADRMATQQEHMAYIQQLAKDKKLVLAGPYRSGGGLFFLNTADEAEAKKWVEKDPSISKGVNTYQLKPWFTEKGLFTLEQPEDKFDFRTDSLMKNPDFSFWIGSWKVYKTDTDTIVGMSRIEPMLNGHSIRESYYSTQSNYKGSSINTYVPDSKQWEQYYVDNSGLRLMLRGQYKAEKMTLSDCEGSSKAACNRVSWHQEGEHVRQVWEQSKDEGKSWKVVFDGTYVSMDKS